MSTTIFIIILAVYALFLLLTSVFTSRHGDGNIMFFTAGKKAPWWLVSIGMVGATLSGISLVSVPGMVEWSEWHYLQMCFGFFVGYIIVAYVLLPIYYKLGLTSIYEYLNTRFGNGSSKTGSVLFVVAKMVSSATKLYVVILVLDIYIFREIGIPFWLSTTLCVALIWLYTHRGGINTIIYTDTIQTLFLLAAIIIIAIESFSAIDDGREFLNTTIFNWNDWQAPSHFVKQFLSGVFVVIVMTGLDQDMMQKNMAIDSLKKSQRNMLIYGAAFIPVNLLLLAIGSAMITYFDGELPTNGDELLPFFAQFVLSRWAMVLLVIGMTAASFASADSALTSITTTTMVDILGKKDNVRLRHITHIAVCAIFALSVIGFQAIETKSIINTIYTMVGYAYGPLLGIFAFGIFSKRAVNKFALPLAAVLSPMMCYIVHYCCNTYLGYTLGYELLMLNGFISFTILLLSYKKVKV